MSKNRLLIDSETNAVMIVWPSMYKETSIWKKLIQTYCELLLLIIRNHNYVLLITHHDFNPEIYLKNFVKDNKAEMNKIKKYLDIFSYINNDIWIRDYGPYFLFNGVNITKSLLLNFNGYGEKYAFRKDAALFTTIMDYIQKNYLRRPTKYIKPFGDLVVEGGNICYNKNIYILNKKCLMINNKNKTWKEIKAYLDYFFLDCLNKNYYVIDIDSLTGDDTNGHIDNMVRIEDNKLMFMSTNDYNHPDKLKLDKLKKQLISIIENNNLNLQLEMINHSKDDLVTNDENKILPFSYLNYLRVSNNIIIPINKNTSLEKKINLKNKFEGMNVSYIDATYLLYEYGSIHCCTNNFIYDKNE